VPWCLRLLVCSMLALRYLKVSRFSCRKCLNVPGFAGYVGLDEGSCLRPLPCSLPPKSKGIGTPVAAFRRSMTQPADDPFHASMVASRLHRMAWGWDGLQRLSCRTLAFLTSCRFIPAHPALAN
jgi:hypothetical protein